MNGEPESTGNHRTPKRSTSPKQVEQGRYQEHGNSHLGWPDHATILVMSILDKTIVFSDLSIVLSGPHFSLKGDSNGAH